MSDARDHYEDRLIERALEEKLGGDAPPDLTPVLAAQAPPAGSGRSLGRRLRPWIAFGVAAALVGVLAAGVVMLPWPQRPEAGPPAVALGDAKDRLAGDADLPATVGQTLPGSFYSSDDVQYFADPGWRLGGRGPSSSATTADEWEESAGDAVPGSGHSSPLRMRAFDGGFMGGGFGGDLSEGDDSSIEALDAELEFDHRDGGFRYEADGERFDDLRAERSRTPLMNRLFDAAAGEVQGQAGAIVIQEEDDGRLGLAAEGLPDDAAPPAEPPPSPAAEDGSGAAAGPEPSGQPLVTSVIPAINGDPAAEPDADAEKPQQPMPQKTWRRSAAAPNAVRLVIGEEDELPPEGLQISAVVDGFRARVVLDYYFYNNRGQQLEGNFKLRLPNEASLLYFAFGETAFEYRPATPELAANFLAPEVFRGAGASPEEMLNLRAATWSSVKEARVVPRQKAAYAYTETVRRRVDPALVEWAGAGVFQARVFPLMPDKLHRIVIGYDVTLAADGDDLHLALEVPGDVPERTVDLSVAQMPGAATTVEPAGDKPFVAAGRAHYHFKNPEAEQIAVRYTSPGVVLLAGGEEDTGSYFALQAPVALPEEEAQGGASRAIFLLDTSLSTRPERMNLYLELMREMLQRNRDAIEEFAVLAFNIESHWWREGFTPNTEEHVAALIADCNELILEGATDLRQALAEAAAPAWSAAAEGEAPPVDLFLLSDGAVTWGETNLHLVARPLREANVGGLFAYHTAAGDVARGELEYLAREYGGAVFPITGEGDVLAAAVAHRQRPWRLVETEMTGPTSDVLVAGRPRAVYPGQRLTVVGRGRPAGEGELVLHLARGEESRELRIRPERVVHSELAPRAYGQVAAAQLEELAAATEEVAVAYARHFRVPGQTCSLLMLETEEDYERFEIKPEEDAFVVRTTAADELIRRKLDEFAGRLEDPKAALLHWLALMEKAPGVGFEVPTALRLAIERMPAESFDVRPPRLVCKARRKEDVPEEYRAALAGERLSYAAAAEEAQRRRGELGDADALKALSSLVEQNPGDLVLLRDVAFSAMNWQLGGQAYPLLRRVALARPFQPQIYPAMARCLAEIGHVDLALVYYEVALAGAWAGRYPDFARITTVEYLRLLRQIERGERETTTADFAAARREALMKSSDIVGADLVVILSWNTDRTDVDLHVVEPSGEVCYYEHRQTKSGGTISADVTDGFGPEMYVLRKAPPGKYEVKAHYFGSDALRTAARTKVYVSIYRGFATAEETVHEHVIALDEQKQMHAVATVGVGK